MPKTTPKRRAPRGRPAIPHLGDRHFKSIDETETGTNEQHVELLLKELPAVRLAIGGILNKSDTELEALLRKGGVAARRHSFEFAKILLAIAKRHRALIEICDGACARLAIVMDRIERGPQEVVRA